MAKDKFETKMERLKKIVETLDNEDTSLDDSIKLYEEGLKLSKELKESLNSFKNRINKISEGENNA